MSELLVPPKVQPKRHLAPSLSLSSTWSQNPRTKGSFIRVLSWNPSPHISQRVNQDQRPTKEPTTQREERMAGSRERHPPRQGLPSHMRTALTSRQSQAEECHSLQGEGLWAASPTPAVIRPWAGPCPHTGAHIPARGVPGTGPHMCQAGSRPLFKCTGAALGLASKAPGKARPPPGAINHPVGSQSRQSRVEGGLVGSSEPILRVLAMALWHTHCPEAPSLSLDSALPRLGQGKTGRTRAAASGSWRPAWIE